MTPWRWVEEAIADLAYARRVLLKSPGFAAVAILTLALGIGANTAVFSIINGALLRPLPYKNPSRLITIWDKSVRDAQLAKIFASYRDYEEFRKSARSVEEIAAATWATGGQTMTGRGRARNVLAIPVSAAFFNLFGIPPERGRTFTDDDWKRGCSIVLSDDFWRSSFNADPDIVGKGIVLDKRACTVLGVMPSTFVFYPQKTKLWTLITPDFKPPLDKLVVGLFARLKPGVTVAQAQTELTALHTALHKNEGWYERDITPVLYNMQSEFTWMAGRNLRTTLWALLAAVGLVLLIACLNVANLLLGRSLMRQREMAVRAALGSGQGRIIRQLLVEGLVLSMTGAAIGTLVAFGAIRYFTATNPVELTIAARVAIDPAVLIFTLVLSIATSLVFGLAPAWKASRVDLNETLKSAGRGSVTGRGQQRLAKAMLTAQMAVSVVLLAGAGLLMESVLRMGSAQLGFATDHVLTTSIVLPPGRYSGDTQRAGFADELNRRLDALPGVAGVALSSGLPPFGGRFVTVQIQGKPAPANPVHDSLQLDVSSEYFQVLKVAVQRGRVFDSRDRLDSDPVAVVNEAFVRQFFPGSDPIGHKITIPDRDNKGTWLTIVGVTANEKHTTLYQEMAWVESPAVFQPLAQHPQDRISIALRTSGDQASIGRAIEREIAAMDGEIPVNGVETLEHDVAQLLAYPRFRAVLFGGFAGFALLLAAIGLHGILQQFVVQRTQEIGVRMAIGARTLHILRLVASQGGLPVAAGLVIGLLSAAALSRYLSSLLYGVQPGDPFTYAVVALTLILTAAVAIAIPAVRAARVDPMVALHYE